MFGDLYCANILLLFMYKDTNYHDLKLLTLLSLYLIHILLHTRINTTTGLDYSFCLGVYFSAFLPFVMIMINLIGGTIVVGILLCIQGIKHPFKSWFNNTQESLASLNLLVVYMLASYNGGNKTDSTVIHYLILIVLVYFILFIIYTIITVMMYDTVQSLNCWQ